MMDKGRPPGGAGRRSNREFKADAVALPWDGGRPRYRWRTNGRTTPARLTAKGNASMRCIGLLPTSTPACGRHDC